MRYASIITIFGPAVGVSLSLMAVRYAPAGIASTLMALTPVLILAPEVMDVLLGARKWTKTWTKRCWSIAQGTIMDKSVARAVLVHRRRREAQQWQKQSEAEGRQGEFEGAQPLQ